MAQCYEPQSEATVFPSRSMAEYYDTGDSSSPELLVAGQALSPVWQITGIIAARQDIVDSLTETVQLADILVLVTLGFLSVPVVRFVYTIWFPEEDDGNTPLSPLSNRSDLDEEEQADKRHPFYNSFTYVICNLVAQIAKLAILLYLIDCLVIVFDEANKHVSLSDMEISRKCAKIVYSTWAAFRLMTLKRYLLSVAVNRDPQKLGKIVVYDRILDILVLFSLTVAILDVLKVDIGPGLTSLFAFGGVGTLVISLACQDMATQLVSGVVVSTSENFYIGDNIRLGNDTSGIIDKIGWLYTDLRGYDEFITRIPNQQFANRRICNISRLKKCQIKQQLRIRHCDLDLISPVCKEIRHALMENIPELITDGTRPFRITLREIHEDHLLVVLDSHYHFPPAGNDYWNNRHRVLELVCRVLRDNNVSLAAPLSRVATEAPRSDSSEYWWTHN